MALKKCPRCGEYYSDTYKECPFCSEDDDDYRPHRRRGGGGCLGPILVVVAILVICFVAWSLFGPEIKTFVGDRFGTHQVDGGAGQTSDGSQSSDAGQSSGESQTSDPDGAVKPGTSGGTETSGETGSSGDAAAEDVVLGKEDVTLSAGEAFVLSATGGDGKTYAYDSDDPGVASVDSGGQVTAISAGTANVTVTSGGKSAVCIVRVKGAKTAQTGGTTAPAASPKLSSEDVTLSAGESFRLTVSGGTASSWATGNGKVASVDGSGRVTAKSSGTATITVSLSGGGTLKCVVRVK
jgi:cytoskeletal protein RodZ